MAKRTSIPLSPKMLDLLNEDKENMARFLMVESITWESYFKNCIRINKTHYLLHEDKNDR